MKNNYIFQNQKKKKSESSIVLHFCRMYSMSGLTEDSWIFICAFTSNLLWCAIFDCGTQRNYGLTQIHNWKKKNLMGPEKSRGDALVVLETHLENSHSKADQTAEMEELPL